MKFTAKFLIFSLIISFLATACKEETYTPKPRAFPRIHFPERAYTQFDANYCHFTFEYPTYAKVQQDTSFFGEKPANPCWFDLFIPAFDARVHCTYSPINNRKDLEKHIADSHELANKHNIKANYIDEFKIQKPNHVSGFVFSIDGPAASPFQFYVTDSTHHFFRGSLYFRAQVKPDSLAPALEFVKKDMIQMLNTFEWTK